MLLVDDIRDTALTALDAIPAEESDDIYVVSFFVYDEEDDPRRPTITVGFNTETQVASNLPVEGDFMRASSESEARWNYAYWLQNQLAVICDSEQDAEGAQLREQWIRDKGWWFDSDDPVFDERGEAITAAFVALAVDVVRRLHADGDIERIFGRPIPVIIHELEYYDETRSSGGAATASRRAALRPVSDRSSRASARSAFAI